MASHKKITYDGKTYFAFEYEEQTEAKHKVFESYFDKWVKIVGKGERLNYIDCFGGCGIYDKEGKLYPGSPIIAASVIEDNQSALQRDCFITILDIDKDCIDNIPLAFEIFNKECKFELCKEDFESYINRELDGLTEGNKRLCPTFFFIDPYGYKVKMSTIKRLMGIDKCEVYFNFMFNAVNRGISSGKVDDTLDELFGCVNWREFQYLEGPEREASIVNLIRNQFKQFSRYVLPYRFAFPSKNRTYYYMIHLSNHIRGCDIMKSCFAELHYGNIEYIGKNEDQYLLFDVLSDPIKQIKEYLLDNVKGRLLTFDQLLNIMVDSTPYLSKDISSAILELKDNGHVRIGRISSKRETSKPKMKDTIEIF